MSDGSRTALDARVVLAGLVSCIGVAVLTPPGHAARLAGEAALVAAALVIPIRGDRPGGGARRLAARFALLLPFFLLLGFSVPFMSPGPAPPLVRAGTAAARAIIGFGALAAVLRAVEVPDLLQALARLRAPPLFVTLMALMVRYLELLEGEAARMLRARDLRGMPPTVRQRAHVAGCMVGSLFLRSFERSERVSVAMQSRGFTGLLPAPAPRPLGWRGVVALGGMLLAQALLVWTT
jgi:cobalt/nickel transport system permease protein